MLAIFACVKNCIDAYASIKLTITSFPVTYDSGLSYRKIK